LEEDLRRLDYVFYLDHESRNLEAEVSTQDFLKYSNYLDTVLAVAVKFSAKFALTTSMRAHQMLMDSMDINMNYGTTHTVYTDMEIQRYAESLTLEYVNKTDLNARIVRLGEIIGEGMDLGRHTPFNQLLLSAAKREPLQLPSDGLETEWYVHILDAAYGVVKAQFTRETEGNSYSLAYENGITYLSVAYKIQEIEPHGSEIAFDRDGGAPPLRLHKPAPNLSQVGWKPSVTFEQAVAESLAAAKAFALSPAGAYLVEESTESKSVLGKIKAFLSLEDATQERTELEADSGPISRLVAERRGQEEARVSALQKADDYLRTRQKQRQQSRGEKLQNWLWQKFIGLQKTFSFLKNISPTRFFGYIILLIVGVIIYTGLVSPAIVFSRNLLVVNDNLSTLSAALDQTDLQVAAAAADSIAGALAENTQLLQRSRGLAQVFALHPYVDKLTELMQAYTDMAQGLKHIMYATEPLGEYLSLYTNNVRFRANSESYLALGTSTDYSEILLEMNSRRAFVQQGSELITSARAKINQLDLNVLPGFLRGQFDKLNQELIARSGTIQAFADMVSYGNDILGVTAPQSYLIILVDNARPMPAGGSLSAYALVTLQNGSVSEIKLQSISDFSADPAAIPSYARAEINTHSAQNLAAHRVVDMARIGGPGLFAAAAKEVWTATLNRNVNGVIVMDLEALGSWIDSIGGVVVDNENFSSANLLRNIELLQTSSPTIARRNDVLAQLLGKAFDVTLEAYKGSLVPVLTSFAESAQAKHLWLPAIENEYSEAVSKYELAGDRAGRADAYYQVYFNSDEQIISPTRFPAISQSTSVMVRNDSSLEYRQVQLRFPSVETVDEVVVCLPLIASGLEVSDFARTEWRLTTGNNKQCVVANITSQSSITLNWETLPIASSAASEYNIILGIGQAAGAEVSSDVEISFAPGLELQKVSPSLSVLGGKIGFTEAMQHDQVIELNIRK
jgi:nucleoside-diphosphate-sugar epimerase